MSKNAAFYSVEHITPRYVKKYDKDGDMFYLENSFTGDALVLCGTVEEIRSLLSNAYQLTVNEEHTPEEASMKPIQSVIQKAFDLNMLRYRHDLDWSEEYYIFDLGRTFGSGVEFGYRLADDKIDMAIQTIDGYEIDPEDFTKELEIRVEKTEQAVRAAQPSQQYTQARAIVDEEPEVTEHNDTIPCSSCGEPVYDGQSNAHVATDNIMCEEEEQPERTWLVTQVTAVRATDKYQAIGRVNTLHGSCDLLSQEAELRLEKFRVGVIYEVWAEDASHAVEQFNDILEHQIHNETNGAVNHIEEVSS